MKMLTLKLTPKKIFGIILLLVGLIVKMCIRDRAVGRPDVKGREEILKVHSKEKPLSEDVDLHRVAQTTAGFTGADLENLMNEAAIVSARENRRFIKMCIRDSATPVSGWGWKTFSIGCTRDL